MADELNYSVDKYFHAIREKLEGMKENWEAFTEFTEAHKETLAIFSDPEQTKEGTELFDFCESLTKDDFAKVGVDVSPEDWERFKADRIAFFLDLNLGDAVFLYESLNQTHYRTKDKARQEVSIVESMPRALAIPTFQDFRNALDFYKQGKAYLTKIAAIESMQFRDGKLCMPDLDRAGTQPRLRVLKEVELQNMTTKEGIEEIDLPLLKLYYTILLNEFQKTGNIKDIETVSVYVPDLAKVMGKKSNLSQTEIEEIIIAGLEKFHTVTGIVFVTVNGRMRKSYYQVLNFEDYKAETNTITFSSPYMKEVIRAIFDAAKRRDKNGNVRIKRNGQPSMLANHSYLALPSLVKERNKAAVTNVFIILGLIEEAGHNIPNIKASTIIERNVQLAERLKGQTTNAANVILKRVFSKTWELLKTQTRLTERYINIQLPDANSPESIPTMSTLDKKFLFIHDGKVKENAGFNS